MRQAIPTQFGSSRYASLVPALFRLTALAQHCFLESVGGQSRRRYRPDLEQPAPKNSVKTHDRFAFDKDALHETRERAVPISFIQAEIEAAVRTLAPAPVYFGLELVHRPGVIGVDRRHVVDMVKAGRAANAAGLVISWDLMHAPIDCVRALAEAA
jgi:hypothetical protein